MPTISLTQVERQYMRMVRLHGQAAPNAKRLDLQDPVADDGETDCWTHSWEVSRATGATYVEGICRRPGAGGYSMHAWVEEDTPFGRRVVECTPGYEEATDYLGVMVDNAHGGQVEEITAEWEGPRSSVLQAALGAGFSIEVVHRNTRPRGAR